MVKFYCFAVKVHPLRGFVPNSSAPDRLGFYLTEWRVSIDGEGRDKRYLLTLIAKTHRRFDVGSSCNGAHFSAAAGPVSKNRPKHA